MAWSGRDKMFTVLALFSSIILCLVLGVMRHLHSDVLLSRGNFLNARANSKNYTTKDHVSADNTEKMMARPKEPPNLDKKYNETCRGPWQINYQKLHENALKTKRFFLFKCDFSGWGNRLRSMLSSFFLAVISKRAFIIDCLKPSPLAKYLEPNFIKWNYQINTTGLSVRLHNLKFRPFPKGFLNTDFDEYFNNSIEAIGNYNSLFSLQKHSKYNLPAWPQKFLYYGCSFHYLFKRSSYLENRLTQLKHQMGFDKHVVLGIHIRRGDVVYLHNRGDVRLAKIEDTDHFFRCAEEIDKRIQEKYKTKKVIWFLGADNEEIKNYASKKYPDKIKVLHGSIEHVGVPRKGNEDIGHLSMFLDFFLLQQSDFRLFTTGSTFHEAISMISHGYDDNGRAVLRNNRSKCILPQSLRK